MIKTLKLTSVLGDVINFTVGESPSVLYYPVDYFDPTDIPMRGEDRPKMQSPGQWPKYQVPDAMPIEVHGAILADDATQMATRRKALTKAVRPFGPTNNIFLHTGTVSIVLEGETATLKANVGLRTFQAPIDATRGSPLVQPFQIIWYSPDPWWIDQTTLNAVLI